MRLAASNSAHMVPVLALAASCSRQCPATGRRAVLRVSAPAPLRPRRLGVSGRRAAQAPGRWPPHRPWSRRRSDVHRPHRCAGTAAATLLGAQGCGRCSAACLRLWTARWLPGAERAVTRMWRPQPAVGRPASCGTARSSMARPAATTCAPSGTLSCATTTGCATRAGCSSTSPASARAAMRSGTDPLAVPAQTGRGVQAPQALRGRRAQEEARVLRGRRHRAALSQPAVRLSRLGL